MVYIIYRNSDRLVVGQSSPPHALAKEIENLCASAKLGGVPSDYTAVEADSIPPGHAPTVDDLGNLTFVLKLDPRRDRLDRIAEIGGIPRSTWTSVQMRELIALMAQELGR
jgi:hypothetical protein